ncbi:MAG: UDP-3-O-(3-hydroxymyristoyl)glucosamine N-acyltransferase [Chlorobiota bacterium]|jgi:UDP-3-O-[3-hydroxymyristoyl] glucosamine N-acyltransferase
MKSIKCKEIAETIEGEIVGDGSVSIYNLNRIEFATNGELTFYSDPKFKDFLSDSEATCIIVPRDIDVEPHSGQTFIKVDDPYSSFIKIIKLVDFISQENNSGIHKSAVVGENTFIDESVFIGPNCVIGNNCRIDEGTILEANVTIQDNVQIGKNNRLFPNVVCYKDIIIGSNCIVHAGAIIGGDGFGFTENKEDGSYTKIPQIGNVIIGDDVEIGCNTTIDRAVVGSTIIGDGVKIDNLCQIGHNCVIEENTGIAAQTGLAGSTKLGKRVRLGGQVGIAGHLKIGNDVTLIAQSGTNKNISEKGVYFGSPARPQMQAFKIEAVINNLPDLARKVSKLEKGK